MLNFLLACIHLDPVAMSMTGGYIGLALLIFAESGLLIGIFLPGDSLLFAAGLLSAAGYMAYPPLVVVVTVAALLGDSVGYWFGANVGSNFLKRKNSRLFKREYLARTEQFYAAHGARTVILARFLPIVRTIAPILAGVARMRYAQFVSYNALGALLWGAGMVSAGYFLGSVVPGASRYLLPLSLLVVVLSFLPVVARGALAAFTHRR
jgi:membrane-associated protein